MSRWFRHYAGMMRDEKLVRAALKCKQPIERVLWIWGAILESAAEIDNAGQFEVDAAEVAYFLRADETDVAAVFGALETMGRTDGGSVVKWGDRQFQSDRSAERQRRLREKQQTASDADTNGGGVHVTPSSDGGVTAADRHRDAPETETELEAETESKKELVDADAFSTPKASALAIEGAFARLKAVYPERDGGDPSTPAKKKLTAILKGGVELEAILVGARNYATEQAKLGHIKTPFVKQKVSWLHSRCWEDYQTTAALVPVHDPTADREPPPGMPTSAEIRKEIEERRANQERRNQELLRVGGGPHSREESGGEGPLLRGADVGRRQPDNPGVERLGTLLPLARMRTGSNENGSAGRAQDDDHARAVAHLVRR